jgi:hypothetical protein
MMWRKWVLEPGETKETKERGDWKIGPEGDQGPAWNVEPVESERDREYIPYIFFRVIFSARITTHSIL